KKKYTVFSIIPYIGDNSIDQNDLTEMKSNIIEPYIQIFGNESLVCCADVCFENIPPLLVTGSMDEIIRVFDLNHGNLICEIKGHKETVTSLQFHQLNSLLLSADLSGTIKGWNINDWNNHCFIIETDSLEWAQWLDQTTSLVVCGMSNGCLQIWDTDSLQFSQFYAPPANYEYHIPYANYGKVGCTRIVYGAADGSIRIVAIGNNSNEDSETVGIIAVWSFSPQRLLNSIEFPMSIDQSVVCHDSRIACSMENNKIYIIDIPSGSTMFVAYN
ncbi:hypothetical protein MXB_272, partial [Myxobolus squamalis]